MSDSVKDIFEKHSLFSLLPDDVQVKLIGLGEVKHYKPGEKLITEGEFNHSLFLILEGSVCISSSGETIALLVGNRIVGEISSSGMGSPVADVIADSEVEVIAFPVDVITDCSIDYPDFGDQLRQIGMNRFG
ncbi:MAG: cyclic nucleotide-binding domain-containing protein [Mariprofundaceae bacterium]|nr:cyclic nucleotide-binding domain-containing protein [Mariprofundaceae bacterium]